MKRKNYFLTAGGYEILRISIGIQTTYSAHHFFSNFYFCFHFASCLAVDILFWFSSRYFFDLQLQFSFHVNNVENLVANAFCRRLSVLLMNLNFDLRLCILTARASLFHHREIQNKNIDWWIGISLIHLYALKSVLKNKIKGAASLEIFTKQKQI